MVEFMASIPYPFLILHDIFSIVDVVDDPSGNRVTKCATTEADRARLAAEARALRNLAHPGVVRLIEVAGGDPPTALVLERVGGGSLGRMLAAPTQEVVRFGASLATTVADLHDVGWIHGAIRAEHVLVDGRGRPVLCGFGSAAPSASSDRSRRRDVSDLIRLMLELLPPEIDAKLRRALADRRWRRHSDARTLARRLLAQTETQRHRRLAPSRYVAAAALTVAGAVSIPLWAGDHRSPTKCPAVDDGCAATWRPPSRYRLAFNGPRVIVIGRWGCAEQAYPAVLALDSGAVWVFRRWPRAGHPSVATLVGQVDGARSLGVLPSSGCDRITVYTSGRTVVLDPRNR